MKVLFKIWYSFIVAVLFSFLALNSVVWRGNAYNKKYGKLALESSSEDKYLFFYETAGLGHSYHSKEAVGVVYNDDFEIRLYEVSILLKGQKDKNDNHIFETYIETYLYPIIIDKTSSIKNTKTTLMLNFITTSSDREQVEPYIVKKYFSLNIFNIENHDGEALVPVKRPGHKQTEEDADYDLLPRDVRFLELIEFDSNEVTKILLKEPFTLTESNLVVRNELLYLIEQRAANEDITDGKTLATLTIEQLEELEALEIYGKPLRDYSEFNYIVYIIFGSYFVVLIVSAYFVFFFKRKDKPKGKVELSEGLKEYRSKDYNEKKTDD